MTQMRLTPAPGPITGPSDSTASEPADNAQIAGSVATTIPGTIPGTITGTVIGPVVALSIEQIDDVCEIAGSEVDAIHKLDTSDALSLKVQLAKALPRQVRPATIRAAWELQRAALPGASA